MSHHVLSSGQTAINAIDILLGGSGKMLFCWLTKRHSEPPTLLVNPTGIAYQITVGMQMQCSN